MGSIHIAAEKDIPQIVSLLNMAYRGDSSRKGWTTEADLIAGEVRADQGAVQKIMQTPGSVFLVFETDGQVEGCVNLQKQGKKLYLGMFAVNPDIQGQGIGKQLLAGAENHALEEQCNAIYMVVISLRTELINWYKRHGYTDTGERKPFPEDGRTGRHLKPLEFAVLEKPIAPIPYPSS